MVLAGLGAAAERHKQEHRRLIEELEGQANALEGRSMSLTMRYLNFWLLHHIETTDSSLAEKLVESGQAAKTAAPPTPDGNAQGAGVQTPASAARTDFERWHEAVKRGLWVAPEPRSAPRPNPRLLH